MIPSTDSVAGHAKSRSGLFVALCLAAIAVGTTLRFLQIGDQIIADDEWHSLHMLLGNGYGAIFTHFGVCDHCIPLTLYDKLVADTVGLSEWSMRAPMLCAGVGALIVSPWLLREYLGDKGTVAFTWLLAISPLHVYFSRYARPYSMVFFLVVVGTVAFARWYSRGRKSWAVLFALCAILAPWFHLAYLPFMAAPFACVLVLGYPRARRANRPLLTWLARDQPRGFWILAATVVLGLCALLVPPIAVDWAAIAIRSGHQRFELPPPVQVYELVSGAQLPLLAFASGVVFLLGVVGMLARARALLSYFVVTIGAEVALLTISGPDKIDDGIVLVRYALPMLAAFLWITAVGLDELDGRIRKHWKRAPAHLATVGMCVALPLLGPLRQAYHSPNNWTNHAMYQFDYAPRFERQYASSVLNLGPVPKFYARIGEIPDSDFTLVEAPWNFEWSAIPYPIYQRIHHRKTLIGFVDDTLQPPGAGELPFGDSRFHFHNFVHVSDFDALRRKHVRFVIFHRDAAPGPNDDRSPRIPQVERWRKEYLERVGKPVFEDERVSVFDLKSMR
jgi:hypothetical protein